MNHTRIMLADDHLVVRRGLRLVLEGEPDLRVVAEVGDGAEAVERGLHDDVDLAVLDISMPRMTGLQAARELTSRRDDLRVLILSMHDNEQYLFEALRAGASGYVLKSVADRDLVEACRATMRGEPFLYPGAVRALMRDFVERARRGEVPSDDPLTPREVEIVKLIAEARTTREIAGDARAVREDGRAPPHEHPRQARDARPRRARPLRDPARTGRTVGDSLCSDGGRPGWRRGPGARRITRWIL